MEYPYHPVEYPCHPVEYPYYPVEYPYHPVEYPYHPVEYPYYPVEHPYHPGVAVWAVPTSSDPLSVHPKTAFGRARTRTEMGHGNEEDAGTRPRG